jgi:hypothetical protein
VTRAEACRYLVSPLRISLPCLALKLTLPPPSLRLRRPLQDAARIWEGGGILRLKARTFSNHSGTPICSRTVPPPPSRRRPLLWRRALHCRREKEQPRRIWWEIPTSLRSWSDSPPRIVGSDTTVMPEPLTHWKRGRTLKTHTGSGTNFGS